MEVLLHRFALPLLLVACGGGGAEKVASTLDDPSPAGGVTTTASGDSTTPTGTDTGTGLVDTGTVASTSGPTGDPEVVACVPRFADCTSTTAYRDNDPATLDSEVRVHDSCGLPVSIEHYQGGSVSLGFAFTYDADHFVTEEFMTFLGAHSRRVYLYDALRLLVQRDEDVGDNGTFEGSEFYTYDAQRRRIEQEYVFRGERRQLIAYAHTGDATVGSLATDDRDDGVFERIESWDRSGAEPMEWFDLDGDGTDDEAVTYTLAADGQPLTAVVVRPGDGQVLRTEAWSYDTDGRQLSHTVDERDDGSIDADSVTTWVCP